jgi:hypothetical protein
MKHVHVWEDVYDDVPYSTGTAKLYGGKACVICGEWYEEDEDELDEEECDDDIL